MSTGRLAGLVALYTGLRFVAFVGCYGLLLLAGLRGVFAIAAALLLSSLLGLFLLRGPRDRMIAGLDERRTAKDAEKARLRALLDEPADRRPGQP